ncbi:MAG TPA: hypothetical protein P5293_06565, partial [Bacteroidales bacterium]|nr:hypothetical protein [Bacteroidales bacterium]
RSNVQYGGTGFFFDKAEPLPYEIEHHMPDYHLYDDWVKLEVDRGKKNKQVEILYEFLYWVYDKGMLSWM